MRLLLLYCWLVTFSFHGLLAYAFVTVGSHYSKQSPKFSLCGNSVIRVTVSNSEQTLGGIASTGESAPEERTGGSESTQQESLNKFPIKNENAVLGVMVGASIGMTLLLHQGDISAFVHHVPMVFDSLKNIPIQAWNAYESAIANNPITTKGATSATVYALGDILSQQATGENSNDNSIDIGRVIRSMIAGGIGHGPLSHVWYNLSEDFFSDVLDMPAAAWWGFIPKIFVDQTVWGPIWNSLYIIAIGILQAEPFENLIEDVQSNTIPLFLEGLKLWPLAHCVTYGLVPVENRLLWVDAVEILWVSILATKAASHSQTNSEQHVHVAETI